MSKQYLGFNEKFEEPICEGEKTATLRYDLSNVPKVAETVYAVVSHNDGAFAKLRVKDVREMKVEEILLTEFDGHQNYADLNQFNNQMKQYYDEVFSLDDVFYYIEFKVVEVLDE